MHELASLYIEGAEGFVHEQNARVANQHLGQGHTLAHATGQLMRKVAGETTQAHPGQPVVCLCVGLVRGLAGQARGQGDVVQCVVPRQQGVGLEQVAGVGIEPVQRLPMDVDMPVVGSYKPRAQVQQCGLAATCGADQAYKFALGDVEADTGHWRLAFKCHAYIFQSQHRRRRHYHSNACKA
ncbi:hypothetical protein D9M71_238890 [compost metagenome]